MRKLLGALVALLVAAGLGVAAAAPAQAATYCQGSTYSGYCYKTTSVTRTSKLVESIVIRNSSKVTVNANCQFTKSLTYTQSVTASAGGSVTASVKAGVLASVEGTVSYNVDASISQSASSATSAGGTFTLKPGQAVTCNRYYYTADAKVTMTSYSGGKVISTKTYTTKIPSSFGITFA